MDKKERQYRNKEILRLYKSGLYSQRELGEIFHLDRRMIENIVKNTKEYSHRSTGWKVSLDKMMDGDGYEVGDYDTYLEGTENEHGGKVGAAKHNKIVWQSNRWGKGPPYGVKTTIIEYQNEHLMRYKTSDKKERSEYDEDDFWKYTI